jgi:hypothetical protein
MGLRQPSRHYGVPTMITRPHGLPAVWAAPAAVSPRVSRGRYPSRSLNKERL